MPKYDVTYARFKVDSKGKAGSKSTTQKTVEAESDSSAMKIITSSNHGYEIEFRKIVKKNR